MNTYDFVHLTFLALGGKIYGRTKLQKTVYFLGVFTGNLEELGYRPHYYGPYSDVVADAITRLKALQFVSESSLSTGAIGVAGFEISRFDFTLTDEGRKIAEKKSRENQAAWQKIKAAVDRFKKAGDVDYMKMSVAAKTYFMLTEKGKPATVEELKTSARKLGWTPKAHEISESVRFLENLKLVKTVPKPVN